nr:unnamed protein product [Callosobruchus analis]
MNILYKKGKLNTNADALSRVEIHTKESSSFWHDLDELIQEYAGDKHQNVKFDRPVQKDSPELTTPTFDFSTPKEPDTESMFVNVDDDNDPFFVQPLLPDTQQEQNNSQPDNDRPGQENVLETVHSNLDQDTTLTIPIAEYAVNQGSNQLIIDMVKHSPAPPKITILFENKQRIQVQFSEANFDNDVFNFIRDYVAPDVTYHIYFEKPGIYEKFSAVLQTMFRSNSLKFKMCKIKLVDVTIKSDIKDIIRNYHESKTNHRGIEETYQRIKEKYFWPNMKKAVQTYINECEICQQSKYERHPIRIAMNLTPTATKPFEIIHIDSFAFEGSKFLTIIDSFSKYAQAYHITSLSGTEIADNLIFFFSHHGVPSQIITDNGTEFKNTVITELLALHKIKLHFISPNHPNSNGLIERFHSTIIEHLRLLNTEGFQKTPIKMKMLYAVLAYNHTVHSVTKLKPIDIINGHITSNEPFDIKIDQLLLNDYTDKHKERTKLLYCKINSDLMQSKEKTLDRVNRNCDSPTIFDNKETVYVKKHLKKKNANKFSKPCRLRNINSEKKTVTTDQHEKVHMSNLKRPLRKLYSFD